MDIQIDFPSKIWPRMPPTVGEDLLEQVPEADIKTASQNPEVVDPPAEPRSTVEALAIARIMVARHGCVPRYAREKLTGKITNGKLADEWDKPNGHFAKIRKSVRLPVRMMMEKSESADKNRSTMTCTAKTRTLYILSQVKSLTRTT